jgi:hypothetical protein
MPWRRSSLVDGAASTVRAYDLPIIGICTSLHKKHVLGPVLVFAGPGTRSVGILGLKRVRGDDVWWDLTTYSGIGRVRRET